MEGVEEKQIDAIVNEMKEMRSEVDSESNFSGSQSSFYKPALFRPPSGKKPMGKQRAPNNSKAMATSS